MLDPHGKLIKPRNFSTNEFMTQFGYFTEIQKLTYQLFREAHEGRPNLHVLSWQVSFFERFNTLNCQLSRLIFATSCTHSLI